MLAFTQDWATAGAGVSSVMANMALGAVAVTAAVAGVTGAIIALGTRGADIEDVARTLDQFSGSAENSVAIMEGLRAGTMGVIDDFELMKSSSKLLAADVKLTADQFKTLGDAASVLADQGLGPTKQMLDLVSQAMLTGQTRALSLKIGKIDLEKSEHAYAKSIGTVRKDLLELEKVEAHRVTILEVLSKKVKEAGERHRDFGEQMQAAVVVVKNWFDELSRAVSQSPAVTHAVDVIGEAFMRVFGGNSKSAIDAIVAGIDNFADAVSAVVPYIAEFLRIVGAIIGKVWEYRGAIVALAAGYVIYEGALKGVAIWQAAQLLGSPAIIGAIKGTALAIASASGAAIAAAAPWIALGAAIMIAYNAYKLWSENSDRAAADARQTATDVSNLASLNQNLGTSYDNLADAVSHARSKAVAQTETNKEGAAAAAKVAEQNERVGKLAIQFGEQVAEATKSLIEGSKELKVNEAALRNLSPAMRENHEILARAVPMVYALATANRELTMTQREMHARFIGQNLALNEAGVAKMKDVGLTAEQIKFNQSLGITLKDMAIFYKVTETAMQQYLTWAEKDAAATKLFANEQTSLAIGMEKVTTTVDRMTAALLANQTAAGDARIALREWQEDMKDFTEVEQAIRAANREMEALLKTLDFRNDPMGAAAAAIPIIQKRDEKVKSIYEMDDISQAVLFASITTDATEAVRELNNATRTAAYEGLANFFVMMGQISGEGGLGKFMTGVGRIAVGLASGNAAVDQLGKNNQRIGGSFGLLSVLMSDNASKTQKMAAGIQGAAAIAMGAKAVWDATSSSATAMGNAFNGAMAGAQAGAAFGPWGIAIGAAAGLVAGVIRGKPAWASAASEVAKDFGVKISDELAKSIADNAKKIFHGNRQASAISSLSSIIKEAGGVNESNVVGFTSKLRDVFVMLETGAFTSAQAVKVLDENFNSLVKNNTDSLGFWSSSLKEIIALNDRFGTQSKAIADAVKGQAMNIVASFNMIMVGTEKARKGYADIKKEIDEATAEIKKLNEEAAKGRGAEWAEKMKTAQEKLTAALERQHGAAESQRRELTDLGTIATAAFAIAIAKGATFAEALAAAQPGLTDLRKAYEDLGMNIEDPFVKMLAIQSRLMENNPALIQGASGLAGALVGMTNLNMLNADTFAAMGRVAMDTYTRIQSEVAATGGSTRDALLPMQDYLHAAAKAAEDLNLPLDEHTQMMIQQSKDLGIWKEQGPTAAEAMQLATENLTKAIENLTKTLQGIPDELPNPFRNWTMPVGNPTDIEAGGRDAGGVVSASGPQRNSRDTIPMWLRPGEVVLTPEQMRVPSITTPDGRPRAGEGEKTIVFGVAPIIVDNPNAAKNAITEFWRQLPEGLYKDRGDSRQAVNALVEQQVKEALVKQGVIA